MVPGMQPASRPSPPNPILFLLYPLAAALGLKPRPTPVLNLAENMKFKIHVPGSCHVDTRLRPNLDKEVFIECYDYEGTREFVNEVLRLGEAIAERYDIDFYSKKLEMLQKQYVECRNQLDIYKKFVDSLRRQVQMWLNRVASVMDFEELLDIINDALRRAKEAEELAERVREQAKEVMVRAWIVTFDLPHEAARALKVQVNHAGAAVVEYDAKTYSRLKNLRKKFYERWAAIAAIRLGDSTYMIISDEYVLRAALNLLEEFRKEFEALGFQLRYNIIPMLVGRKEAMEMLQEEVERLKARIRELEERKKELMSQKRRYDHVQRELTIARRKLLVLEMLLKELSG